jgi:wobble nucleotide-excising tRNase
MIKTISIKNIASYDNEGIILNDLKKINFIYGANGTGKTTISNFIADKINTEYLYCNIKWEQGEKLNTLVYNKKFRENNFGNGKIEGVFTLGEATKDDINLIEEKQEKLKNLKDEGTKKNNTLEKQKELKLKAVDNFKEYVWLNVYKKYEKEFKEAFQGSMQKESFLFFLNH